MEKKSEDAEARKKESSSEGGEAGEKEGEGVGSDGGVATDGDRNTTEMSRSRISVFDFSTFPLNSSLFCRYFSLLSLFFTVVFITFSMITDGVPLFQFKYLQKTGTELE